METLQPLAIESFSYSWLSGHNHKPSLDGLDGSSRTSIDNYYRGTSEEFNYEMVESNSFATDQSFNFDAIAQTPAAFIHADELFTNGFIRPIYIDPLKRESCDTLDSIEITLNSSFSSSAEIPTGRTHCSFLGRWRKSTKQIFRNLCGHLRLRHVCYRLWCLRKSNRVDDIDWRMWKVKSWNSSPQASPQQSTACSMDASCHLENSIYEAVLHCKRSIEK
ncbi:hypothetical protein DITRI_Ditri11bG0146500 [Diplodiscus trichospermus]